MHVLDLICCLFQFFSASPRFASSFRKRASVSTSLKMIQKTYSRNNSQTSSNPPGLLQLLQCPPGSAEPRKGPACGSGARGGSRDRDRAPLGRRDGHGSSSVPRATQPFRRVPKALLLLSWPPRAHPLRFSQHPACFVDLGQNILELHSHFQHWYSRYSFQCFRVS